MCSIYGVSGKKSNNIRKLFSEGLNHRGPDDSGYYQINNNSFVGHTRLSIIDTSNHGHQPMISNDNNFIIVFNGEIYNHHELRKELAIKGYIFKSESDTEVILNLFIEYGDSPNIFLNKIRGMFAFCIYNKNKKKYFLARDRFGIKPLVYGVKDKIFYFSSELKPLIKANIINKEVDLKALSDYMKYGCVHQPNTIYKEVKQLMPGSYMCVDENNEYKVEKYYILTDNIEKHELGYDDSVKKLREKLEEATKYHMVSDVDVGAFLSGGVDSTAAVALMKGYSNTRINTFSIGFPKNQNEVVDELSIARKSAKLLDTKHHEIEVTDDYVENVFDDFIASMDQPTIDGINTYIVSKVSSKFLKVAISGLGGDEIFAGYPHFERFSKYPEDNDSYFKRILKSINNIRPNRYTDRFQYSGMSVEQRVDYIRSIDKDFFNGEKIAKNESLSKMQRVSVAEIDNYLLNMLLRDSDNFSMAHSLEVRPVLLDHSLVEFSLSLNDKYKINNGVLKSIFIDSVKDLIQDFVYGRKKSGFVMPVVSWMNSILNNRMISLLDNNYDNLLTEDHISQLKYRAKNKAHIQKDWKIFILLSWLAKNKVYL